MRSGNKVVFRHIRPDDFGLAVHRENDNLYGITVRYEIDYNSYTVRASWAICRGDNFDKHTGRKMASFAKEYTYRLDTSKPLSLSLFENLQNEVGTNIPAKTWVGKAEKIKDYFYEDVEKVFLKASRMQKEENL